MLNKHVTAGLAAGVMSLALVAPVQQAAAQESITVVTGGGSYGAAIQRIIQDPFTEETGIETESDDYGYSIGPIRSQVMADNVYWDVAVVEKHAALRGCDEGLFERLDHGELPDAPDGTPATEDFIERTLTDCTVGLVLWSQVYAYDERQFPDEQPRTAADFFDLEKFPGPRGLLNKARGNLEFALMADGVPPEKVYEVLETDEGVERAFDMLDTIKDEVVFWEAGAQAPQLLADGEVAMTTAWNGRIQSAIDEEGQPFDIVWNGQMYNLDSFAILKGTENLEAAKEFIRFAARPDVLAGLPKYIAYGPVRRSALEQVPSRLTQKLPTNPEHLEVALEANDQFWAAHGDDLQEQFSTWMLQ